MVSRVHLTNSYKLICKVIDVVFTKRRGAGSRAGAPAGNKGVLNAKKKVVLEPSILKSASGQYMPSPWCSHLFNPESLAPNLYKQTTI